MKVGRVTPKPLVEIVMAKNPIKADVEASIAEVAGPTSNFDRLRTHLEGDSLALKLLDAWRGRETRKRLKCSAQGRRRSFRRKEIRRWRFGFGRSMFRAFVVSALAGSRLHCRTRSRPFGVGTAKARPASPKLVEFLLTDQFAAGIARAQKIIFTIAPQRAYGPKRSRYLSRPEFVRRRQGAQATADLGRRLRWQYALPDQDRTRWGRCNEPDIESVDWY